MRRGGRQVLRDVAFRVGSGEALVVRGPNGSGKSTLLRAIAGLLLLEAGAITVDGGAAQIHLVGHQNALKPQLTVFANALFWAKWQGADEDEPEARAERALEAVALDALAEAPAQFLSQGQRRRLALARLLASRRAVWLLDEPVAGLDARSREIFAALMAQHLEAGGAIIASTHEPLGLVKPLELSL